MSNTAVEYARANEAKFRDEFFEFLRIQTISTDAAFAGNIQQGAEWVAARMKGIGIGKVDVVPTTGHPIVCGEWAGAGKDKPTVLFYAHYDVQPADPLERWDSPPFEPTLRDGKIYARGVVDDKIGVYACLKAVESFLKTGGNLPVNMKFLFEGEEETGSPSALEFLRSHKERVGCDVTVICDGSGPPESPTVALSCRGLVGAEVTVTGPPQDIHSGSVGGLVENPVHTASRIIASFHDSSGRILIPGFYDGVPELSPEEKRLLPGMQKEYLKGLSASLGDFAEWGDPDVSPVERIWVRPTCDVNGIYGGYQGYGMKTIIPSKAGFKVTMRLAPGQDPDTIAEAFTAHVKRFDSESTRVEVEIRQKAWPATSDPESKAVKALIQATRAGFGKEPAIVRMGGTVPIAGTLLRETGIAPVFLAVGTGGLIHSPNEFMYDDYFITAIEMVIAFLAELGAFS
ncbi:MAG: M20/M25/M40 family metallo-hydrolase [Spirochaetales bacterium]|nr:M20/M25/M40 family metallo-hydrolase [Spirochaetales bacterium]